jgi:alpha/beta superfamily hydrolase
MPGLIDMNPTSPPHFDDGRERLKQMRRMAVESGAVAEGERGSVTHEALNADSAVILASGTYGGIDGPSSVYGQVAERLQRSGVTCVRLDYARLNTVSGGVQDVLTAIEILKSRGVTRVVLVGWSFGGAVVANAGVASQSVVGVAFIASQKHRAEVVARLSPRPLLLVHGTRDMILSDENSRALFALAKEPKELWLIPGADHFFTEHTDVLAEKIFMWCHEVCQAKCPERFL